MSGALEYGIFSSFPVGGDLSATVIDQQDGILVGDCLEEIHQEFFLTRPWVGEEGINFAWVESIVNRSGVNGFAT